MGYGGPMDGGYGGYGAPSYAGYGGPEGFQGGVRVRGVCFQVVFSTHNRVVMIKFLPKTPVF